MSNYRTNIQCALVFVLLAAVCGSVCGDVITLNSGTTYKGKLIAKTDSTVKFRVILGGGTEIELDFPADKVRSVTAGDVPARPKPPVKPKPPVTPPVTKPDPDPVKPTKPVKPATPTPTKRSATVINTLIQKEGKSLPAWWDSVKLNYPRTLDLKGVNRAQGWQPRINLGAYFFSLVTPHPQQWKQGVKLLHHVVDVRKGDRMRQPEAMAMLANYYNRYLEDYPRAAYWGLRADKAGGRPTLHGVVGLAECYFHMGNKAMAETLLKKYRLDLQAAPQSIKLWAELGQTDLALKQAMTLANQIPYSGYMAAGNLHRLAGRYDQAAACYDKVLAANNPRGHGKLYRRRAQECGHAVRLLKTLDISKVADGTYNGMSMSYRGPLNVAVKVSAGKIASAKVTSHKDDIFFTSITKIPQIVVEKQSLEKIDAVSGATVTCEAILNAATKALSKKRH
ncbi:MAG: FMN-binding protein [Phycisphaerales bacterium]|nr:FMN-binding protein [Phycisphaerales bacterium]